MILQPLRPVLSPIARSVAGAARGRLSNPSLMLEFAGEAYSMGAVDAPLSARAFNDLITFTRASGGGRFNAAGQYEWLPANTPRIDYDPVTGECLGLLIEEQRTNLLTDSGFQTSTVGASLPANWSVETSGGLTTTVQSVGVKSGVGYADIRYQGTATAAACSVRQGFGVPTAQGASKACSAWLEAVAGNAPATIRLQLMEMNIWSANESPPLGMGKWGRFSVVRQSTAGNSIRPQVTVPLTIGQSYDFVLRIGGTQLEDATSPSSYIPTTTAQVTRAADVASVNVLSPWFNASEGTLFVEYSRQWESSPIQGRVAYLSGPDTSKAIQIRAGGSGAALGTISNSGAISADIQSAPSPAAGAKAALSWNAAGASLAADGALVGEDGAVVIPQGLTTLWLGNSFGNTQLRGHIRSIRYYPKRLSGSELQAMTA